LFRGMLSHRRIDLGAGAADWQVASIKPLRPL
jgi:hypothetical protein